MGQHKYNPTAIAAKEGKIPPKKKSRISKRQSEWLIQQRMENELRRITGIAPSDFYSQKAGEYF